MDLHDSVPERAWGVVRCVLVGRGRDDEVVRLGSETATPAWSGLDSSGVFDFACVVAALETTAESAEHC